jgi:hypothetical protein
MPSHRQSPHMPSRLVLESHIESRPTLTQPFTPPLASGTRLVVSRHGGFCLSGGNHYNASSHQQTGPAQLRVDRVPLATPATPRSHPPAQPTISKHCSITPLQLVTIPASTPTRTLAAFQPSLPSQCPSPQNPPSASPAAPPLDLRASLPPRPHPTAAAASATSKPLARPAVHHWALVPLAATRGQPPLLQLGATPCQLLQHLTPLALPTSPGLATCDALGLSSSFSNKLTTSPPSADQMSPRRCPNTRPYTVCFFVSGSLPCGRCDSLACPACFPDADSSCSVAPTVGRCHCALASNNLTPRSATHKSPAPGPHHPFGG